MHLKHLFGCIDARKTYFAVFFTKSYGPLHEKTTKRYQNPVNAQISLVAQPVLSVFAV